MKTLTIIAARWVLLPASGVLSQTLNDAQIASIVVTANQVDIDEGSLAEATSHNADVKALLRSG